MNRNNAYELISAKYIKKCVIGHKKTNKITHFKYLPISRTTSDEFSFNN